MLSPNFINIDIELSSEVSLSSVVSELGASVAILLDEKIGSEYKVNFECVEIDGNGGVKNVIRAITVLMDKLSPVSKRLIANCNSRVLNIGYNSGSKGCLYNFLSNNELKQIVDLGFGINLSIYGINPI